MLFNETPVHPRKCTNVMAKILYLINQGESLGTTEATECFFAITKLFQSKDTVLRSVEFPLIINQVFFSSLTLCTEEPGYKVAICCPRGNALYMRIFFYLPKLPHMERALRTLTWLLYI